MKALRNIILSMATISLVSCASVQKTPTRVSENTVHNKLKSGESGVYILRADSSFYNTPLIAIDDKPAGGINSSSYVFSHLQPGTHRLSINQGYLDGTVNYQFQVKPGQATYLNMAWGKLPKDQKTVAPTVDKVFASNHGWVIATMSEQSASNMMNNLGSGNIVRLN